VLPNPSDCLSNSYISSKSRLIDVFNKLVLLVSSNIDLVVVVELVPSLLDSYTRSIVVRVFVYRLIVLIRLILEYRLILLGIWLLFFKGCTAFLAIVPLL
jgi:hypothetical protein